MSTPCKPIVVLVAAALAGTLLAGCQEVSMATADPGEPSTPVQPSPSASVTQPTALPDPEPTPTSSPTRTPEPIVPTPAEGQSSGHAGGGESSEAPEALPVAWADGRDRFGVCGDAAGGAAGSLGVGWYLTWGVESGPRSDEGPSHWQMVRLFEAGYRPEASVLVQAAEARPGAIWLIGNEPDVRWQDNVTPERYAELYHELYHLLKGADPGCRVAIGGVSQPTPLRLAYLDRVLAAYLEKYASPMPVDVWNVHNFILREELDSWGVGIPPGFADQVGTLREVDEHDDLTIFRDQLVAFRQWMADRGQRERPLVVSEYGILMPSDYGFDFGRVRRFMVGSFDLFAAARSEEIGYPADDNRLVQHWAWYSLSSETYPTGNLVDAQSGTLTPLGTAFAHYQARDGEEVVAE